MRTFLLPLIFILSLTLFGRESLCQKVLTVDLAEGSVDITTGFDGAHLVLFGMKEKPGDLAIVISGPDYSTVVRQKEDILGMWMNRKSVGFTNVPAYYDYALSVPESELAPVEILQEQGIGLGGLNFIYTGKEDNDVAERFREALIRNKQAQDHYPLEPEKIVFLNEKFFRTGFYLPADVPTGHYVIRSYLFSKGKILDRQETRLEVAQVGFSARLYHFAHDKPWAYGFTSVLLAVFIGGLAHVTLQRK
jgi:uncharacterized protein (TIGR02186 family)